MVKKEYGEKRSMVKKKYGEMIHTMNEKRKLFISIALAS